MTTRRLSSMLAALALVACGGSKSATTTTTIQTGSGPAVVGSTPPPKSAEAPLPLWAQIRRGVLPNGLTYYVMKHPKPEKRAYLWLAINAGSVQEDDDQRGLAHLIEHMCFNGTKRFPEAAIVNYLESIGMGFGADLNAATEFDSTTYKLSVPTDDKAFVAKGFDILHDWAGDVTFDAKELDKERGVVIEEWRGNRGAQERLLDKELPVLLKGTRYPDRNPIGLVDTLKQASRDVVMRFYKDWYRPDLMAIIAVGDFEDPAAIEAQIKATFGDLKNPAKERPRTPGGVPKADGTRVAIDTDKELPLQIVQVANVIPHRAESTQSDFRRIVVESLYTQLMNERFASLARKADAPFLGAQAGVESLVRDNDEFGRTAAAKSGQVEESLRALFAEVLRVDKHGFTQTELDRAKTNLARFYETQAAGEATQESDELVDEITRNFYEGEFMIGRTGERDGAVAILPTVTLAELNALGTTYGGAENRVITLAGPEGKPLPTKERVLAIIDEVSKSTLTPWEDKAAVTSLMAQKPKPGAVKTEKAIAAIAAVEWTLANGVKVIVKPTDYEADSVTISASSPGGLMMANAKQYGDARFASTVAALGGVGDLDEEALGKALAGKAVTVSASIGETTEGIDGGGSAKDLETMLQLVYLRMTAPRKDADAIGVWRTNYAQTLEDQLRDPETQFQLKSSDVLFKGNVRRKSPTSAEVKKVDADRALAFYKDRFGDATDFTFVIVGAVDLATLKPLVEQYLGSLPAHGRKEKEKDSGITLIGGVVKKEWKIGQEPKASVQILFHGDEKWTLDKDRDVDTLGQVLSIRLREVLREDLGGTYGVSTGGYVSRTGKGKRVFTVEFGCDPTRVDELVAAAEKVVAEVSKAPLGADYLEKVKAQFVRERERQLRTNSFWSNWLEYAYRFGDDPTMVLDPAPRMARMTAANVQAAAKHYLDTKQYFEAVLKPATLPTSLPTPGTPPVTTPPTAPTSAKRTTPATAPTPTK